MDVNYAYFRITEIFFVKINKKTLSSCVIDQKLIEYSYQNGRLPDIWKFKEDFL